jgi:hypothetical protein
MRIRIGRIILLAIAVEILTIAALAALVAIFGPHDRVADQAYAEQLGRWVGPIGSAVLCFLAAVFLTRRMASAQILNGFLIGAVAGVIDLVLLVPFGVKIQLLILISITGRMVAGTLGGWIGSRSPGRRL